MCTRLRNTARRGRSGVPSTRRRIRKCRRWRASRGVKRAMALLASLALAGGLAGLAADALAEVADALALVRLGRPQAAYVGRELPDRLLVDAAHREAGREVLVRLGRREGLQVGDLDAGRRRQVDRVREAERQDHALALLLTAVADAVHLERLAEALGHAGDHVRDQRPGQAVQRAVHALVGRPSHLDDAVLPPDLDVGVQL